MKNSILTGILGLIVGLAIGFFYANSLNRTDDLQTASAPQIQTNPNVQPNILVKEQPSTGGKMPDIQAKLDKAENEPNNFEAQIEAGKLYFQIKNFDKAAEFYNRARSLNPTKYEDVVSLGNAYFDIEKFEDAGEFYLKALEQKPDDVSVRTDLGVSFVERENPDLDRAIQEFEKSLEVDPKHVPTLYNLGIAFYKKQNVQKAREVLKKLESVNPQSELTSRLKQLLQNQ